MILTIQRDPLIGDAIPGRLFIDGAWACFTLERAGVEIYPGHYRVTITPSGRVAAGTLWSPREDDGLPLIGVPGRSGIRVHALNRAGQTEGCLGVGNARAGEHGEQIVESRMALVALMDRLAEAMSIGEVWIDVVDAV